MGWTYPHGVNRKQLIAQRVEGWERETGEMLVKSTCLKHCYRGGVFSGVLWSVWERTFTKDSKEVRPTERWIQCDLLRCDRGEWGYKDLEESMGPYYFSCPLGYLDLVPIGHLSDDNRKLLQMVARSILEAQFEDEKVQVSESKRLLSLLETQRKKLLSRNLSDSISDELYDQQRAEFDEQERRLRAQMARQERIGQLVESVCGQAGQVFDVLANDWLTMERRARQLALSALFGGFRLEGRTLTPENGTPLELFRAG